MVQLIHFDTQPGDLFPRRVSTGRGLADAPVPLAHLDKADGQDVAPAADHLNVADAALRRGRGRPKALTIIAARGQEQEG